MTYSISTGNRSTLPAFFPRKEAALPSSLPAKKKELATPYYSIPTASRVQNIYRQFSLEIESCEKTSVVSTFTSWVKKASQVLSDYFLGRPSYIVPSLQPPPSLKVDKLPEPVFHTFAPPRKFYAPRKPSYYSPDEYTPSCLLTESKEDPLVLQENNDEILQFVEETLKLEGVLKQDHDGHVYLSIATNFALVDPLLPFLFSDPQDRSIRQMYFSPALGIHCTIISASESARCKPLGFQKEIGRTFSFRIKGCYRSDTESDTLIEKAWFLVIDSPELEQLRESYLLPTKVKGHGFYATLIMKRRPTTAKPKPILCRLNVSCFAA